MAKETVQKFFDEVSKTKGMEQQLNVILEKSPSEIKAQAEAAVALAKEADFEFTTEEFVEYIETACKELNDNELDSVTGGISVPFIPEQYRIYL